MLWLLSLWFLKSVLLLLLAGGCGDNPTPIATLPATEIAGQAGAEDTPAIQLSDRASRMPGLADTLRNRVGGEVFLLGPGATTRGLWQRCPQDRSSGGLTLLRHLPWDQAPVDVQSVDSTAQGGRPTHVLFGNHAHSIGPDPLVLRGLGLGRPRERSPGSGPWPARWDSPCVAGSSRQAANTGSAADRSGSPPSPAPAAAATSYARTGVARHRGRQQRRCSRRWAAAPAPPPGSSRARTK